jgi:hypothetical protein
MTKDLRANSDDTIVDTYEFRPPGGHDEFPPTLIFEVDAARGEGAISRKAIASLCGKYWYPLYAFLRKRGRTVEDAQDLTQGFFLKFLGGNGFSGFDPSKGRLRSYMLGALKNYEAEWVRTQHTQRKGGRALPGV